MSDRSLASGVIGELFWKISDPVLVIGSSGIETINPAAERAFGVAPSEVGPDFDERVFGSSSDRFYDLVRAGSPARFECPALDSVFLLTIFIIDEVTTCVVLRDVTIDEKQVEALRRLNRIAGDLLTQESLDLVLQTIADEAKVLTGASFGKLQLFSEDTDEVARIVFSDGIAVQESSIGPSLKVPLSSGGAVLGDVTVANQRGEKGFTEVDRKVLTELGHHAVQAIRLIRAREEIAASDSSRQAMLDLLRHDMMTPIATARGASDLLLQQFDHLDLEQRTKLLKAIARSVEGLERIGRNLRTDARMELSLGHDSMDIEVSGLIDELIEDLTTRARSKNVELKVEIAPDCPSAFGGSYLLVRQALENLVTNAIRFSPEDDSVVLTARLEGESVRFDVSDNGPGIPFEEQGALFTRFFRSRRKDDPPQAGLGLGLSIVQRVADAHGGTVGVVSEPGHGSTFWITFPLNP